MKGILSKTLKMISFSVIFALIAMLFASPAFAESGASNGADANKGGKIVLITVLVLALLVAVVMGFYKMARREKRYATVYIPKTGLKNRNQQSEQIEKTEEVKEVEKVQEEVVEIADEEIEAEGEDMFASMAKNKSKTFEDRLNEADEQTKANYEEIKAEFLALKKVKQRISRKCDSYRLGRDLLAKIIIRGKSVRVYFALEPKAYEETVYHHKNMIEKKAYKEVPMEVRIRSPRSLKKAKRLVAEIATKYSLAKK